MTLQGYIYSAMSLGGLRRSLEAFDFFKFALDKFKQPKDKDVVEFVHSNYPTLLVNYATTEGQNNRYTCK